ncbi:FAD/NAD(P)-binding domain-containing protein [Glonium stellatum]|uniref:FAD/NAD(P)-binding domain-containing protein n=1 Tax=Glonium stellatum TaxID=574774 RepID=A0A8E2JTQ2_9PEZI|nr:FAD/NAD(P)-binding domain-containing protein [Glonium stellatum]
MYTTDQIPSFRQVACVGSGLSAVALGATLKIWYGLEDIKFFERHPVSGGTWWINSYPGCACDVPSALYSYSFELNPDWTKLMPSNREIKAYHDGVIEKYGLRERMVFSTEVLRRAWNEEASLWIMFLQDKNSGRQHTHQCQILFSATGQLVEPRPCDIPGHESFAGDIFHSARWKHDINLKGKNIIVVGNGCTAAQIVPAIVSEVKHIIQIVRTQHWIFPSHNFGYGPILHWIFKYVPFAMRLHRFHIFMITENDFRLFPMTKAAARLRENRRQKVEKYMRDTAPAKYHDILIPDFDVGCKGIMTLAEFSASLHSENLTLTDDRAIEIVSDGIKTEKGFIPTDIIILATGFQTNEFLQKMEVIGRNGETVQEHWLNYPGPEAYNCSVLSGFPNFFMLLGPNAATGHTSALMAAENPVNYALRVLKPVFEGKVKSIELKREAEDSYVYKMQEALGERVWNAGRISWYLNEKKWNAMSHPWSQSHFWFRSLFPVWPDWSFKVGIIYHYSKQTAANTLTLLNRKLRQFADQNSNSSFFSLCLCR